jgi:NTP pyrophosphatase (non-canonical NTP hydrolase)
MLNKLMLITEGLNRRFPEGNHPFQIATRLLEECGELAQAINHFEGQGVKREKYGEPDKAHLAKEVQDVMRTALQVALHYQIEEELKASIEQSYRRMVKEGLIENLVE